LINLASGKSFNPGGNCTTCHSSDVRTAHPNCTTCHGEPPSGTTFPNIEGAHSEHNALGFGTATPTCNACHNSAPHYNHIVNRAILSSFNAKSSTAIANANGTCSSTRCHGGKTTPGWSAGIINVNTECISCHASGTTQYNSYNSGEHDTHVSKGYACTVCHNTTKLQTGHFINLETSGFEQDPAATIGGGSTMIGAYNGTSCSNNTIPCHGFRAW
jgi:predicted CxxxxCH...CXXCH cytochrome family protein